ncbi:MAG: tRNA (N6-isopentenyl adenosine(37)-C2)-methylthiotransferase MiaB [Rickettsiales bacterium]|nr:tRNA (N6-isopentenyl adenosine(37)-C2)-methylthiotransferase MiaB [Rickettsiales bacterium]
MANNTPHTGVRKVHIKTYGCQMNVYDSERMADVLYPLGYTLADAPEDADLVILNTCHIREKASEKVYSELGRLNQQKRKRHAQGQQMLIAVAGCVGQAEGEEIFTRAPFVDMVVGPQAYHKLPDMIAHAEREGGRGINLDFAPNPKFDQLPEERQNTGVSAFLSVQEGCDKFCTFCVVPYTRGAEFSRSVPDVYREALGLVQQGVQEITLLGQNVNAYHGTGLDGDTWNLARLIRHLAKIRGVARIRYTTSHPRDMDDDLVAAHGDTEALMPYLHLPIQSGSDRILKAMNRRHTAEDYLKIIEKLRQHRPDIQFSSDFIVGFPGETDADFEATLQLVRVVGYAQAYSFKYSPRPGTPAANDAEQVPEEIKKERLVRLQLLLSAQQRAFNASCVNTRIPVLFDRPGRHEGQMMGKTPWMQSVHVVHDEEIYGSVKEVEIVAVHTNSLSGRITGGSEHLADRRPAA